MYVNLLIQEFLTPTLYSKATKESLIKLILLDCLNNFSSLSMNEDNSFRNKTTMQIIIIQYIQKNFKTATLNEVADYFGYSSTYFSKKCLQCTGKNFKDLVLLEKDKQFINLLINSKLSIQEIAQEVNISDLSYYYNHFKKKNPSIFCS